MYEENIEACDVVWLTVSEIPLVTQPTRAPPPSRPPPPRPARAPKVGSSSFGPASAEKGNKFSYSATSIPESRTASIHEVEDFAVGKGGNWLDAEEIVLKEEQLRLQQERLQ